MKKSLIALFMAFVLMLSAAAPAAMADCRVGDLMQMLRASLAGKNDGENDYAVEKFITKILGALKEKADAEGINLEDALRQMVEGIRDGEGKMDLTSIGGMLEGLFSTQEGDSEGVLSRVGGILNGLFASGDPEGEAEDAASQIDVRNAAIEAYVIEEYKSALEPGEVQVVTMSVMNREESDILNGGETLGFFALSNFEPDGSGLKLKNYASNVEVISVVLNEDGSYTVAGIARAGEGGEEYEAGVDSLCEQYGFSSASFRSSTAYLDWYEILDLMTCLENYPEYDRIEYQGEMKTWDELNQLQDQVLTDIINTLYPN